MSVKKLVIKVTEKSLADERSPKNPAGMSGGGNCGSGGGQSGGNCGGGGKCAHSLCQSSGGNNCGPQ